jgi:hypothetical protein
MLDRVKLSDIISVSYNVKKFYIIRHMSWLDAAKIKYQLILVLPLANILVRVRACTCKCVCVSVCGFQLVTFSAKFSLLFSIMTIL